MPVLVSIIIYSMVACFDPDEPILGMVSVYICMFAADSDQGLEGTVSFLELWPSVQLFIHLIASKIVQKQNGKKEKTQGCFYT
jgi:hypothetical protein